LALVDNETGVHFSIFNCVQNSVKRRVDRGKTCPGKAKEEKGCRVGPGGGNPSARPIGVFKKSAVFGPTDDQGAIPSTDGRTHGKDPIFVGDLGIGRCGNGRDVIVAF
jgi:hypothetical protein